VTIPVEELARWFEPESEIYAMSDEFKASVLKSLRLVPKLSALQKAVENGMDDDLFDEQGQWILVGDELKAALAALDAGEGV